MKEDDRKRYLYEDENFEPEYITELFLQQRLIDARKMIEHYQETIRELGS